jgi:Phytanoyl-CoA dioxygenase (PhyH)
MNKFLDKLTKKFTVVATYIKFSCIILKEPLYFSKRLYWKRSLPDVKVKIDRDMGFVKVDSAEIKGINSLLPALENFCQRKILELDQKLLRRLAEEGKIKPYFINLLLREDVELNLDLIKFALSDEMLAIVSEHMGFIPNLSHIALFYSGFGESFDPARDEPRGTQKFHIDNHDISHIKFFLYLDDVNEEDGPLVVLPAKKTWRLRCATKRILSTKPFKRDSEFKKYISDLDLVALTGKRGDSFFIDTSKVYHYGSRYSQGGRRLALVIHYVAAAEYSQSRSYDYQDLNLATSIEFKKMLDLSNIQSLAYKTLPFDECSKNSSAY